MKGKPHGEYLIHLTLQSGNAVAISEVIFEFTGKCNINDELKVIGYDSSNVKTGCMGGATHQIEDKIGHSVMWLIYLLHTNELLLRHWFINLDGETCGKDSFLVAHGVIGFGSTLL